VPEIFHARSFDDRAFSLLIAILKESLLS